MNPESPRCFNPFLCDNRLFSPHHQTIETTVVVFAGAKFIGRPGTNTRSPGSQDVDQFERVCWPYRTWKKPNNTPVDRRRALAHQDDIREVESAYTDRDRFGGHQRTLGL